MSDPGTTQWQPPDAGPPPKKKMSGWWWLLIIPGILAGLLILVTGVAVLLAGGKHGRSAPSSAPAVPAAQPVPAAPTPVPATSPTTEVFAPGDIMVITQDGQDAAEITITRVSVTTQPADAEFGSAPQNGYYVTAHVRIKVESNFTEGFNIYSGDFYAKVGSEHYDEGQGNAYDAPGNSNEISADNLGAGETAGGTLVFDLPAPHGKIAYAPNYDGQALGYWRY